MFKIMAVLSEVLQFKDSFTFPEYLKSGKFLWMEKKSILARYIVYNSQENTCSQYVSEKTSPFRKRGRLLIKSWDDDFDNLN